jgi:cytochrome bd-type quinol oxidase subunit 2
MRGACIFSSQRKAVRAFLASGQYLLGMSTSVASGVFPNVLSSNTARELGLTIYDAASAEYGLIAGLWCFIPECPHHGALGSRLPAFRLQGGVGCESI